MLGTQYPGVISNADTFDALNNDISYASMSIEISFLQALAIKGLAESMMMTGEDGSRPGQTWSLDNNCVDFVRLALECGGIELPALLTFIFSDPEKLAEWILQNGGREI